LIVITDGGVAMVLFVPLDDLGIARPLQLVYGKKLCYNIAVLLIRSPFFCQQKHYLLTQKSL
jgi:hypothetical protein